MKLLLDSHAFLWWIEDTLPPGICSVCMDEANTLLLSAVSAWELQIKQDLGKLRLSAPVRVLVDEQMQANGLALLPVELQHIWALADLPRLHGDPFDRLLLAQARHEGLTLVSADSEMRKYPVHVLWE